MKTRTSILRTAESAKKIDKNKDILIDKGINTFKYHVFAPMGRF